MKVLCELNDQVIMGQDNGRSSKPLRLTARGIVQNQDGLYAVMYAEKFNLHSLPGGGLEGNEDILTALRREILEETGCTCDEIRELGLVEENRGAQDYTQKSYYFVVNTNSTPSHNHLTVEEAANGTIVKWVPLQDMVRLICDIVHPNLQRKYLQAWDAAALKEYLSELDK